MEVTPRMPHEAADNVPSGIVPVADDAELAERQRVAANRFGWIIAWGVSIVALIVGISLTATGTVHYSGQYDDYGVFREVWPAGLVLLAVGALGIIATALATMVVTQKR